MKTIAKFSLRVIILVVVILAIIIYISLNTTTKKNVERVKIDSSTEVKSDEETSNEQVSLNNWIGGNVTALEEKYGLPNRIDKTEFQYEWWIYNADLSNYLQFAIADGKIVSCIGAGKNAEVAPFMIGEKSEKYNNIITLGSQINFKIDGEKYSFEFSETDIMTNPLVELDNCFAQVYIDKVLGNISAIRFIDKRTLVKLRPYNLSYTGEIETKEYSDEEWREIEAGYEQQVIDLTNVLRIQFKVPSLVEKDIVSTISRTHSKDMAIRNYFSHVSPDNETLSMRLANGNIIYRFAGENIASGYVDSLDAVEGWLNSEHHREGLLEPKYSIIGSGVYRKYFTQNFIEPQ